MDDFSIPGEKNAYGVEPSESNMIQPGKRPQSSTAPTIFLGRDGVVRLVLGASGGTKITTAISLVSIHSTLLTEGPFYVRVSLGHRITLYRSLMVSLRFSLN